MKQTPDFKNNVDQDGMPAGGSVWSTGMVINWQDGVMRKDLKGEPISNGAFVETVIESAIQRLEFFQNEMDGKFACDENHMAILALRTAVQWLEIRTLDRIKRNVEGKHEA
jgi:hypothetical protein